MPGDPITPSASAAADGGTAAGSQPGNGATPPAAPAGDPGVSRAEFQQFANALVGAMHGLSQQVSTRPAPAAPAADPKDPGARLLTQFAAGDLSPVDARVAQVLQDSGVVGFLGARAQAEAAANERIIREQVDAEFGTGTYEKELKEAVERQLGDSVAARSLPQAWDNALAMAKGQRFGVLSEKRAAAQAKAAADAAAAEAQRMNAPWMPGNGIAPQQTGRLDAEDQALMQRISAKTGGRVPKAEEAAKLRDLMYRRGNNGVSMEDIDALGLAIPA